MATLLAEIRAKCAPELIASKDAQAIADAVNVGRTKPVRVEIGNGTILETLGLATGSALLDVINSVPDYRHVKPLLEQGRLISGSPVVAGAIAALVAGGVITQADGDRLAARGLEPDPVSEFDVRRAIWSDAGEYLP